MLEKYKSAFWRGYATIVDGCDVSESFDTMFEKQSESKTDRMKYAWGREGKESLLINQKELQWASTLTYIYTQF